MNKFWTLTRVLFKNGTVAGRPGSSRQKVVLLIAIAVLVPILFLEAVAFWSTYGSIVSYHLEGAVLAGLFSATCAAMVFFGILHVISTYYFADDAVFLLAMPIPPRRILAAKFTIVMLSQYWFEILIVLPCLVVFGIRGGNFFYWINALFVFVTLPLLPMVICSVVTILVMAFSRFFRNKDRVKFLAGVCAVVFSLVINVLLQMCGRLSAAQILQNSTGLMRKASSVFPSNMLAVYAVLNGTAVSLLWLAAFLLLSAAAAAVFLLLGDRLYLHGVVGLSQAAARKESGSRDFRVRKHSAAIAVAVKDWRLLYRTPAFAINCLFYALLLPVILPVMFAFSMHGATFPQANALVISASVLFLTLISMMNMISPTAVSRDGHDAALALLFPVRAKAQLFGKLIPGLGMSFVAMVFAVISVCILFRPDILTLAAVCGLSFAAIITCNMLGLFIDAAFPKLTWDDETVAVKQNNVTTELFVTFLVLVLPVALVYKFELNLVNGILFLLCYNLVWLAAASRLLFQKGAQLYSGVLCGTPVKKTADHWKTFRLILCTVIILAVLGVISREVLFVHTNVRITDTQVTVSAGLGEGSSFSFSQIQKVYINDTLPPVSGRIGFALGAQMRGIFNVEGLGRGHVYTQNAKGPFLFIILRGGTFIIFNFDDSSKTMGLYDALKKYGVEEP